MRLKKRHNKMKNNAKDLSRRNKNYIKDEKDINDIRQK